MDNFEKQNSFPSAEPFIYSTWLCKEAWSASKDAILGKDRSDQNWSSVDRIEAIVPDCSPLVEFDKSFSMDLGKSF